jgi:hypothetical protein
MKEFSCLMRINRNEKGFILPVTMVIVFLLAGFVLHEVKMHETDSKFLIERQSSEKLDELLQMAVVDVQNPSIEREGLFYYDGGTVRYQILSTESENVVKVDLTAKTSDGKARVVHYRYDTMKNKIIMWEETDS